MGALGIAGMYPQQLGQTRYELLTQQAQPAEQRAFNTMQTSLFNTGRLGTTGGGIQTEAFARGLGEADLSRQMAASEFGRQVQADAMQRALGGFGAGRETRTLEDMLNQSRFGRGQTAFQNFFGNALSGYETNRATADFNQNAAARRWDLATNLFNLERGARTGATAEMLQNLGGIQGLQGMSLEQLQAALEAAKIKGNIAVGAGSTAAQIGAGGNPFWGGVSDHGAGFATSMMSRPGGLLGNFSQGPSAYGASQTPLTPQQQQDASRIPARTALRAA